VGSLLVLDEHSFPNGEGAEGSGVGRQGFSGTSESCAESLLFNRPRLVPKRADVGVGELL